MKNGTKGRLLGNFGWTWIVPVLVSTLGLLTMAPPLHATDDWVRSIRDANLGSLVFITVKAQRANGLTDTFTGTGFVVHPAGYVLSCNYVIPAEKSDYTKIAITGSVGGRYEYAYPLTIVRRDEQGDVMLLKLPQRSWQSVKSIDQAQVGSDIAAFGFPLDQDVVEAVGLITGVDHLLIPISFSKILLQSLNSPLLNSTPTQNPTAQATATPQAMEPQKEMTRVPVPPQWPSYTGTSQFVGISPSGRVTVYVDPTLGGPALQNAQDLVKDADRVVSANDAQIFGAAGGPVSVIIFALGGATDGTGGADHAGCNYTTGAAIEVCASFGNSARVSALFENMLSECSMGGNLCGVSTGEALSRWCAAVISNNALADFATAPQWARDGMPDYVNQMDPTDQNADSTGCGMAFLSWLMSQGHRLDQIAQTMVSLGNTGTLAQLYANLTSDVASNAWPAFLAAVKALPNGVTYDDPFGGALPQRPDLARRHPSIPKSSPLGIDKTPWNSLRTFMHWHIPKDSAELTLAFSINIGALGVMYFLFVFALYCIAPAKFAAWHEWIANREVPFSDKVSQFLALFLLDTPHCLNAVVRRYQEPALKLFKRTPQFKSGSKWVPAPLSMGDDPFFEYRPPHDFPPGKPYVAGLWELKSRLSVDTTNIGSQRWTISIEGPGGIGKSSLALQIALWASDSRPAYRLAPFPILPLLIATLGKSADQPKTVDEAAATQLRYLMSTSKESTPLIRALLFHKRVLVVVDGVSEMPQQAAGSAIQPEEGAANTRALVVTSRTPTHLSNSLVIRPQELTVSFLDRVLDKFVAETVGSKRFDLDQRKELRARMTILIEESGSGSQEAQVPMLFLKLMVQMAGRLLDTNKPLDELPTTLSELVVDYTAQLLRNEPDVPSAVQEAARAAKVCLGKTLKPASRSATRYTDAKLSKEVIEKFVTAGIMVKLGLAADPFYKFAIDPIAEQLYANHIIAGIRDERAEKAEIDDLMVRWEQLPEDFISALRRAATNYRDSICETQPALVLKLWPQKEMTRAPADVAKQGAANWDNPVAPPQWPSYTGTSQFVGISPSGRVNVYVDPTLGGPALQNAQDLVNDADRVVSANNAQIFRVAGVPVSVIVFAFGGATDGTGGAAHCGCSYTTGAAIEVCASFGNSARVSALFESALSQFSMGENLCGVSTGKALSRWCAAVISNNALADFATAPRWAQHGMPDYVNQTEKTDHNADSTGCGMAFLSWLMSQGHGLDQIAQRMVWLGNTGTLAQLYAKLTSDAASNAWPAFLAAVEALPNGVTNDDPFGGASQEHSLNQHDQ